VADRLPTRREQARKDSPGFRKWPDIASAVVVGLIAGVVLWLVWGQATALQEIVVVAVGVVIGFFLWPALQYAAAYLRAPRRILEARVQQLEAGATQTATAAAAQSTADATAARVERDRQLLSAARAVLDELQHADGSIERWLAAGYWAPADNFGADAWTAHKGLLATEPLFSNALDAASKARSELHGLNHEHWERAGGDSWGLDDNDKERLTRIRRVINRALALLRNDIGALEKQLT
jgi:hypothetical protein